MNEKIRPAHLEREAVVYVRQSSAQQVRDHTEGRGRQYALAERARDLGFARVNTIDEDLGKTGSGLVERPGFGRLLSLVCDGVVGAVLAFEASRLARNNRDWHHLIDLCALTDTLVIDLDGVYDPRQVNDRLLLGLKGSMSEFELGLLRQRAREAIDAMAARGVVFHAVPIGYVRTEDQRCELDPDLQIQEAIRRVYKKFHELGAARQVLLWYREEKVTLPSRTRGGHGPVRWELPTYSRILGILTNPTYAGAYVRGRTRTKTKMVDGRARRVTEEVKGPDAWGVLLKDHHEGYITWEEYMRNQERLSSNLAGSIETGTGAPKSGAALLAGLLRCGRCGRKLRVRYGGTAGVVVRYECEGGKYAIGVRGCFALGGIRLEREVSRQVQDALSAEGIDASLEALERARSRHNECVDALGLAVERARYETLRSRRQYDSVDPENRLVACELERRWETALESQRQVEERLEAARQSRDEITDADRQRILALGANLPTLWEIATEATAIKKRIIRALVEEIVIEKHPEHVDVRIHWKGGAHTLAAVPHNGPGSTRRCIPEDTVALVRDFCQLKQDRYVATILNGLSIPRPDGAPWTRAAVTSLRHHHDIPCFDPTREADVVSLSGAAARLGIDRFTLMRLVDRGIIPARRFGPRIPTIIRVEDLERPHVREAIDRTQNPIKCEETHPGQASLPFFESN